MNPLLNQEILLQAVLANPTNYAIVVIAREGDFMARNAGADFLLGLDPGPTAFSHAALFHPEDQRHGAPAAELVRALELGRCAIDRRALRADGSSFHADGLLTPLFDASGEHLGFLAIFRDATERKRSEDELRLALNTDALTGLANRFSFNQRLQEWTRIRTRSEHALILHVIDLDRFKEINDRLGHQAGDLLLQQAGAATRSVTRETDFVARLGGDEFAVIQTGAASALVGSSMADKILGAFARPFDLDGQEARVTPSIGVAVAPQDGWTPDELLRKADAALYRVKRQGRNQYGYFTPALDLEAHRRSCDIGALREAVAMTSFHMVYQPKVSARHARLVEMEALLRCDHPLLTHRPIAELIALATECGLTPELGRWALEQACQQAGEWFRRGFPRFQICVNLCAREISDPQVLALVDAVLQQNGLSPADLVIELTEHDLLSDEGDGIPNLRALSDRGVSIALDDFGTGYSSLGYLTTLPVKCIKLDQSFARKVPHDWQTCIVVKAIIGLAHALKIDVVAEGIETLEQFEFFREQHSDLIQGFYFCQPLTAEAMTTWMRGHFGL